MTTDSSNPKDKNAEDVEPVLTLIKRIKEHKIDPAVLTTEDRRRCVEVLWSEGYSIAETAQILQRGERTIYRDRSALRSTHALHVHPGFAPEMAGELMRQTEGSMGRLRRIAREPDASAMERCMAEQFAIKAHIEMITKLQSMGYLPRVPTGVVAQVVGASSSENIATYDQILKRIDEIESVEEELELTDPETLKQREKIKDLAKRGRASAEIGQMYDPRECDN